MTLEELITRYKNILASSAIPSSEEEIKILKYFDMISQIERSGKRKYDIQF